MPNTRLMLTAAVAALALAGCAKKPPAELPPVAGPPQDSGQ